MAGKTVTVAAVVCATAFLFVCCTASTAARSVYEHYTEGGITSGLRGENDTLYLNNRKLVLHSGALHYFRLHPSYWRDILRKFRAAGLVAVETYVPWNLHEPYKGVFDFGKGGEDMSPFLDIEKFLKIAKEEDLLVILRPGPYICAEWEFGGLPSWLLRDTQMKVRTSDPRFMSAVKQFFDKLLPIARDQQFTKGGSIIAFQIENEYGFTKKGNQEPDKKYLAALKKMYEDHNLKELYFTADGVGSKYSGTLRGEVFMTGNMGGNIARELSELKTLQPGKPAIIMEYYSGWFDHWGETHHTRSVKEFTTNLEEAFKFPASVNIYMFYGGTSFGFLNGANTNGAFPMYSPDTSSYDYDSPLTEAGDYTPKYHAARTLFAAYQTVNLTKPELPPETPKEKYGAIRASGVLDWNSIIERIPADEKQKSKQTMYMEHLNVNNNNGQSYGYVSYRTNVKPTQGTKVDLTIKDTLKGVAIVIVDGKRVTPPLQKKEDTNGFGYWIARNSTLPVEVKNSGSVLDIIIENWGRVNFGAIDEFNNTVGLAPQQILVDKKVAEDWEISSVQFKGKWIRSLNGWNPVPKDNLSGPLLLRFALDIKDKPKDTFLDMRGWGKGVAFVNGFNLGRYCSLGPIRTLYVPAPLLNSGVNQIVIFEHFTPPKDKEGNVTLNFAKENIF